MRISDWSSDVCSSDLSSGVQIADELQRAGKQVYLSVGAHDRPPRAYRNRDFCWWLGVLGEWDAEAVQPGKEHVTIAVSGARGGHTVDFRKLAHEGRSEEHTSELQSLMRISYAVFCLKKNNNTHTYIESLNIISSINAYYMIIQ